MVHRWMVPLTFALLATGGGFAFGQSVFPAPLPSPPMDGSTPNAVLGGTKPSAPPIPSPCSNDFAPLREDVEKKGKAIRAASERHAPPQEECKIIGSYSAAEAKMMKFVETNAAECGIPGSVMEQLKAGHKTTEALERKVCAIAEQSRGVSGQINDIGDPAFRPQPRGPVGDFPDSKGRY